ncbi:MAG: cobalamin B12-binding domain-containing protein [Deltaproteobacteria bacterium]|nr:cobalamin B12-binding domain-containing protein [Deltaproteobacteria bacterium]
MKILLIYPYFLVERIHEEEVAVPPIGLYSVAALLLENGYEVEILNWQNIDKTPGQIQEVLKEKNPEVVGFSILNANRWGAIEIARAARELNPRVRIVFGGVGATFLWEHLLTHFPEIDAVVLGEGEYPFLHLIRQGANDPEAGLEKIAGIAFRKDGQPLRTPRPAPILDLDSLPDPAQYFTFQHVVSSRGCAWNCTFCGSPGFWGRRVRFHSPEYFVAQLERLYCRGVRFFFVSDDTLTMDKERLLAICRGILERGLAISWNAISRVDRVDEEILYWMRQAGCIQISYGLESGSEQIRRIFNKKIKTPDIQRAFTLTQAYGILARAYFIYGSPGETDGTIRETLDLLREIKPLSAIFYMLDLFPGTELYSRLKAAAILDDDIWLNRIEGILYGELDLALSAEKLLAFGRTLRTAFYENVHTYADQVRLVDKKDLYPFHADFLSRLGLTFSQGDYAKNDLVREKEQTAERLFQRALGYAPDHRAYLGWGMLKQKAGAFTDSIRIFREGLEHFPENPDLTLGLGISQMNIGNYQEALAAFERFPDAEPSRQYTAQCRQAMRTY